jgi:hypothetical protein
MAQAAEAHVRIIHAMDRHEVAVTTYSLVLGDTATLLFSSIFAMHTASSIVLCTLYVYTPEMIPTKIRATALGLCVSVHELAHVAGPWLLAKLASQQRACAHGARQW